MTILIVEDKDEKFEAISNALSASKELANIVPDRAKHRNDALRLIHSKSYDLIIVDLNLPALEGLLATDETSSLVDALMTSDLNKQSAIIVLSGYPDIIAENKDQLQASGISIIEYGESDGQWRDAFRNTISRIESQLSFDFVLIAALEKEADAYRHSDAELGKSIVLNGLECRYLNIDELKGIIVRPARMGLVDATVATTLAISLFSPRCVFMSGICGGVEKEARIGKLVIADPVWEYQAGKWADENFKIEVYQQPLNETVRRELRTLANDTNAINSMKSNLHDENFETASVELGPMATGSAVIASGDRIKDIAEQHRKLMAIDMEMYGVFRAVALARISPMVFGAKTVVDTADSNKGDQYHTFGCIFSARFCVEAIRKLSIAGHFGWTKFFLHLYGYSRCL